MFFSAFRGKVCQNGLLNRRILGSTVLLGNVRTVSTWGQLTHAFDTQRSKFILPKTTGLFGLPELDESSGFKTLCDQVLNESRGLVDDALCLANEIKNGENSAVNLIMKFDHLSNTICNVADLAEFVRLTHPNTEYQKSAGKASLAINGFVEKLNTNVELYNALKSSLKTESASGLDEESRHVAGSLVFDFEQSGIHLDASKRREFVRLQESILRLGSEFVAGSSAPTYFPKKLWPNDVRHGFHSNDEYIQIDGLCYDSPNSALREIVYKAYMHSNPTQLAVLDDLLESRHDLAKLVGFPSFLSRSLRGTMAETPETVNEFLMTLAEKIRPEASKDSELLKNFKQGNDKDGAVMPWDTQYFTGLAKSQLVQNFPVMVHEYFSLGTCMEGLNMIFQRIYGITLEPTEPDPGEVWHPLVVKLSVKHEDEGILGYIYCDLYYRENKVQQDCHFTIRGGCQLPNGSYQLPVVVIVCNFPSPEQHNTVTLLSHSMIENLFHEMGHAMHSMLGRTSYQHVTGTRTATDIVEVPSILMENYAWSPAILSQIGRHYRSGKQLPEEAVQKLCQSRNLFSSLEMQTQMFYSLVDQTYHGVHPLSKTTTEILKELQTMYMSTPYIEGTSWQQRFAHLHGGYAGRYYSYLWCRAVASRIWHEWFENDPLSREAGERYRQTFLKYGGGRDPRNLVEDMLGQEITVNDLVDALANELRASI